MTRLRTLLTLALATLASACVGTAGAAEYNLARPHASRCRQGTVPSGALAPSPARCHQAERRTAGRDSQGTRSQGIRSQGIRSHGTRASHTAHGTVAATPTHLTSSQSQAASTSATIAGVLATPCENGGLMPEAGNVPLIRAAVVCLVNRVRAQSHELPLKVKPELEVAAQGHAEDMIASNYFEHVSPSGVTPVDRVRAAGYIPDPLVGYVVGENLAWGTLSLATPEEIVAAWIASPGHLANILEAKYRDTGIGVVSQAPALVANGVRGATYAQEFGVIVH